MKIIYSLVLGLNKMLKSERLGTRLDHKLLITLYPSFKLIMIYN